VAIEYEDMGHFMMFDFEDLLEKLKQKLALE
jgi:hypothetical protein